VTSARCADLSLDAGESLAATATTAEHWLLVEVPGSWPRDVLAEGALPAPAQRAVIGWLERTPSSRLLFIRRPGRAAKRSLAFAIHASEAATEVRRIELAGAADLVEVDFDRDGELADLDLVLVCGHGSRDACCALRGVAVYGALTGTLDDHEALWVSSHQGGHRFAANVLVLPAGLHLGRVAPEEAPAIVSGALSGRIALDRYRGRTCYPAAVQAAEQVVRGALGLSRVADLRLEAVEGQSVRLRGPNGLKYETLVDEITGPTVPASCGADPEPQGGFSARMV
jgi:hypothetical protein